MSSFKTSAVLAAAAALTLSASVASAQIYDQSDYNSTGNSLVDQEFADFPDFSTYMVDDVNIAVPTTITDVTTYFTLGIGNWAAVNTARLNIIPKSGSLPPNSADPSTGTVVPVTLTFGADVIEVHASGLNVNLAAGDYWFGLTPITNFGTDGQEFHQYTTASEGLIGDVAAARNPGGGFGVGTDWIPAPTFDPLTGDDENLAMLIDGVPVPEPTALGLAALGGLGLLRRRR